MSYKKKLIEVALPLPEINDASAYDKMPGIGPHPKGIHHWWARLPLPTARAVLFASVVDDPSEHPERFPTEEAQNEERERLFDILRRMMGKKLHEHPEVYSEAHAEMLKHCDGKLPAVFDPFAGGGSIPLEASRLGFEAHAGDLNPVAVLLNKCNLELAPRWVGFPPVNPEDRKRIGGSDAWRGTDGLAADVRYYGRLICDRTREKIGHLYPKVQMPEQYGGRDANVIAWIWARTVETTSPAFAGCRVPLVGNFIISSAKGNEAHLESVVVGKTCEFFVKRGVPTDAKRAKEGTAFLNTVGKKVKATFRCLLSGDPLKGHYIDDVANKSGLGLQLMAIVVDGGRKRVYLDAKKFPTESVLCTTREVLRSLNIGDVLPTEPCRGTFASNAQGRRYGFKTFSDYFTPRQLVAAATLVSQIREAQSEIARHAAASGLSAEQSFDYARTVTTFLALALDRCLDFNNALTRWSPSNQKVMNLFSKHAIAMVWDFAEANILGESVGGWSTCSDYVADCIEVLAVGTESPGDAQQVDAAVNGNGPSRILVSTDPPYYDNISYSSLSDFFYVWLRRSVGDCYPELMSTMLTPKTPELTASPEKFDADKDKAKEHFESGFRKAFTALRNKMDPRFPLTVYYAFKQDDEESSGDEETESESGVDLTTGWETLLEALIFSGFQITATWPVRASQKWRMISMGTNALASYIVLACRPRSPDAPQTDRRSFVAELKRNLPSSLRHLQQGNIAPVDFAQAAIGPGMAVYSRYSRILESKGAPMTVRAALTLINQTLTEVLSEQEDEFDADTRWAMAWFEQYGFAEGEFGVAETLSKAKNTSVDGMGRAGILAKKSGKVRLLKPAEILQDWDPVADKRPTIWEMTHHLLRVYYHEKAGDEATAELLRKIGANGEIARDLAYRLFNVCEKKKWSQEAQAYNALVLGWPEIARLARESRRAEPQQGTFL